MRAPVSHDPVTAVRAIAFASITDNRVIWNTDRCAVNYRQRRAGRLQARDTVGQTFGTSRDLSEVRTGQRVEHDCGQSGRESYQADSDFPDSVAGQVAPAMWSTNENNTLDPRVRAKHCGANNQTVSGVFPENALGSLPQTLIPHCFRHGNYLVVSEHPTHAVADQHIRLVVRIKLIGFS